MPKTQDIINGLHAIANDFTAFAIAWHIIFYLLIAALLTIWKPANKLFVMLICLPLVSVAAFAWLTGNPFNGMLFSIMAILVFIFGLRTSSAPINLSQLPFMLAGILMIIFGLLYPHFTETDSFFRFLYASPGGLIPCPTLSIIIGFALIYNGFGSQPIMLIFIVFGLFYSVFGVLKLGVNLDLFLLFGTIVLLVKYITSLKPA